MDRRWVVKRYLAMTSSARPTGGSNQISPTCRSGSTLKRGSIPRRPHGFSTIFVVSFNNAYSIAATSSFSGRKAKPIELSEMP
jgi:hypothetical protein